MKCPLCCEFVPSEELLQDHYLTKCSGLADEDDDEVYYKPCGDKTKLQYISLDTTDKEIYFLSTFLDVPQVTLAKVSDDLFQSAEIQMPKSNGPFEGQLVVGDDVLSVSPFTIPTGGLITLHVTREEYDAWSTPSTKTSNAGSLAASSLVRHSASMSSITSECAGIEKSERRRTLSDQSSVSGSRGSVSEGNPKGEHEITSDSSSMLPSENRVIMAERTSSKDSMSDPKICSRRKRRHRRFPAASLSKTVDFESISSDKNNDATLIDDEPTLQKEKEVQELKAEISKLRIENRKQAKELNTLSKVIDGPLAPQAEGEIVKRENNELKQELGDLRKIMLRQEQNFNKKISSVKQDPVEDWKKGQIDKLHRSLAEAEQKTEECLSEKMKLEEDFLRAKEKIGQLRETRDTLRSSNDAMCVEMKKTTEKLEAEISELHTQYLSQGRELGEAEKLSQSADNMRGLVERLTIENEELTRQNTQLSMQTSEFEKVIEKLKNKVSSLEIELDFKRKRGSESDDLAIRKKKEEIEEDELGRYNRKSSKKQHPLMSKGTGEGEKTLNSAHPYFNEDDVATSTPMIRKAAPLTEHNYKSDHSEDPPPRNHNSFLKDRQSDSYYKDRLSDSYVKPPEPYIKDRRSSYHLDNNRIDNNDVEFEDRQIIDAPKNSTPFTYTKPAVEEDDTYKEALAIVEKYKRLDMNNENSTNIVNDKYKSKSEPSYNPRMKLDYNDSTTKFRRKTGDVKWSGLGEDVTTAENPANETPTENKLYSSSPWLQQQSSNYTSTYVNGPSRNGPSLGPHHDGAPSVGESGNECASDSTPDYRIVANSRYDSGNRASYCGNRYTLPTDTGTSRVRIKESDDEADSRPAQPPQNISDLQLGSRVVFKRGPELERGTVQYTGKLIGKEGQYVGVELSNNTGNHDGTFQNHTYFRCKPKRGIFIPINKVQLVYPSV